MNNKKTNWNDLTMRERAAAIRQHVHNTLANGGSLTDVKIDDVRHIYDGTSEETLLMNSQGIVPTSSMPVEPLTRYEQYQLLKSAKTMGALQRMYEKDGYIDGMSSEEILRPTYRDNINTPLSTFFMDPELLRKVFKLKGYVEGTPGDYGLISGAAKKANNPPIYQTRYDAIDRSKLLHVGNILDNVGDWVSDSEAAIPDAYHHPAAFYVDKDGNPYVKEWDLNDYGGSTVPVVGSLIDMVGSPTVVTTGFQPADTIPRGAFKNKRTRLGAILDAEQQLQNGWRLRYGYKTPEAVVTPEGVSFPYERDNAKGGYLPHKYDGTSEDTQKMSTDITAPRDATRVAPPDYIPRLGETPISKEDYVREVIRKRLSENIDPTMDYKYSIPAVWDAVVKNEDTHGKYKNPVDMSNITGDPDYNNAIWRTYLQLPADTRFIERNEDVLPMRASNDVYYRLNNLPQEAIDNLVREGTNIRKGGFTSSNVLGGYGMNNHSIGRNVDPRRGEFVSYMDTYDLNPFHGERLIMQIPGLSDMDDLSFGIGKPVNLYDRVYLDDYYGTNAAPDTGDYYGGYLPEAIINGSKGIGLLMNPLHQYGWGSKIKNWFKSRGNKNNLSLELEILIDPMYNDSNFLNWYDSWTNTPEADDLFNDYTSYVKKNPLYNKTMYQWALTNPYWSGTLVDTYNNRYNQVSPDYYDSLGAERSALNITDYYNSEGHKLRALNAGILPLTPLPNPLMEISGRNDITSSNANLVDANGNRILQVGLGDDGTWENIYGYPTNPFIVSGHEADHPYAELYMDRANGMNVPQGANVNNFRMSKSMPQEWIEWLTPTSVAASLEDHDSRLDENYSDLGALRSLLKEEEIYNSELPDLIFTEDMYNEIMKRKVGQLSRFLLTHSKEQVINALNYIAYNLAMQELNPDHYAKKGGKIKTSSVRKHNERRKGLTS